MRRRRNPSRTARPAPSNRSRGDPLTRPMAKRRMLARHSATGVHMTTAMRSVVCASFGVEKG